jgi:hypothetical protein
MSKLDDLIRVAKEMQTDAENDAIRVDRTPFDKRGVGEHLGTIYADVATLAKMVETLASTIK